MEVDTERVDQLLRWLNQQQDTCMKVAAAARTVGEKDLNINETFAAELFKNIITKLEEAFAGAAPSPAPKPAPVNKPPMVDLDSAMAQIDAVREMASYNKCSGSLSPAVRANYAGMEIGLETALALLKTAKR